MAQPTDDRIDRQPRSMTAQYVALGFFAVAGIVIGLAIRALPDRPAPQPLARLTDHILVEGNQTPLPVEIARFFHIPHDGQPLMFRMVKAGSHDGRVHSIAARKRPGTEHVDILLGDTTPEGHGYHYLTSPHGYCLMAAYADTEMRPVPDAAERFAIEVKNWLEYLNNHGGNKSEP